MREARAQELDRAVDRARALVRLQRRQVQISRRQSRGVAAWAQQQLTQVRERHLPGGLAAKTELGAVRLQRAREGLLAAYEQARSVDYAPGSPQMARLRRAESFERHAQEHYRRLRGSESQEPSRELSRELSQDVPPA